MKKFATAAVAATMALGLAAPAAKAADTVTVTNTMVNGNCVIKVLDGGTLTYNQTFTPTQAEAELAADPGDGSEFADRLGFLSGIDEGSWKTAKWESRKAMSACTKSRNYKTDGITALSLRMDRTARLATFWTLTGVGLLTGIVALALPALKPMLPANIAAMLP
ncbi:hypothetical protein [Corynebacterium sp. NML120713]|uniref:hypothetical protein n=1 Tax=Corynebacterium sp. NML120713 TaxID=1906332 RepID=UPI0008FB8647|nr:hypothetical protein [Corynebacterium sp. NML120713]OIR41232.1 hypothetical protein BJP06_10290 [Corynebacterium sp. NML120713]